MYRTTKLFSATVMTILIVGGAFAAGARAADSPQFRGPERSGIFPETGLLEAWPEGGPRRLWITEPVLGESYASVSVADGRIYTTGLHDERGSVFAFDLDGQLLWKRDYGPEFDGRGYPGTRTTPTVHGGRLFFFTALGKAVALEAASGKVVWEAGLLERYGGENTYFGAAESPLVVDDLVIFTPGGKDASLVAVEPDTGEVVWTTKGLSDRSAYCSPQLLEVGDLRQIVTLVQSHLVGISPSDGTVLWRTPVKVSYDIHATAPVFEGRSIYISHGYKQGGQLYELAADGRSVTQRWTEPKLDIHHGGAVFLDGHIYGAASGNAWHVLDAATGKIDASIQRLGKGSVIWADGLLYGYTEKGEVVLVNPDPNDFRKISSFEISEGSGHHWAHPVIAGGVLYIRHGEVLMAYDIAARSAAAGP